MPPPVLRQQATNTAVCYDYLTKALPTDHPTDRRTSILKEMRTHLKMLFSQKSPQNGFTFAHILSKKDTSSIKNDMVIDVECAGLCVMNHNLC